MATTTRRLRELLQRLGADRRRRVLTLWGANTDVGKTLVSVGLVRESIRRGVPTTYLKPMQTGYPEDSDERKVARHANQHDEKKRGQRLLSSETLFAFSPPVSPHLCGDSPGNEELQEAIVRRLIGSLVVDNDLEGVAVLETFGGPGSPTPSRTLQVDALRPLFFPGLLVGDSKLGGISTTLAAYEMIKQRGYEVRGICMMLDGMTNTNISNNKNHEVVRQYVDEEVVVLEPPDARVAELRPEFLDQSGWRTLFDICFPSAELSASNLRDEYSSSEKIHKKKRRAMESIWWPFTQHADPVSPTYISHRTMGDHIATDEGVLFDASASWWTQGMGEDLMPGLSSTVAAAIGRYGHVLFPRHVHDPALDLATAMLDNPSHAGYSRAFFSDDGSTAVEVGLKMALRKFLVDRGMMTTRTTVAKNWQTIGVLGVEGSYHGDTLGTMDAVPPSVFTELQSPWVEPRGVFLQNVPCLWMKDDGVWLVRKDEKGNEEREQLPGARTIRAALGGQASSSSSRSSRRKKYAEEIASQIDAYEGRGDRRVGTCILEPVVQGAGGMRLVDPEYQRAMVDVCRERNIPVVADEVFSGLWRLGAESAAVDLLGIRPDVGCFAKLLTAGVVPLSLTLATEDVFDAFKGDSKALALLHGHSYTAHPIGCAAANYALKHLRSPRVSDRSAYWSEETMRTLSRHPRVDGCWSLGTVASIKLVPDDDDGLTGGYESGVAERVTTALRDRGISARPLGDVVYLMATPFTSEDTCDWALGELVDQLDQVL
jgi:dethiobiotin synthetase/adenosylmethionine--8-amino-7-oxononanoate aminotransferase